jgi:TRAP-type mannitol/chloroaromatic compound transport system substrate-binding protein
MAKGTIDGSDWSTPQSAVVLGLPEVAKVLHYPGWARPVHLFELIVNEATWGRLGADAQRGFEQACRNNMERTLAAIPVLERQGLADLRNRGITVLPYPAAVQAGIRQAGQKVLEAIAKDNPTFARVLASYNKYR